MEKTPEIKKVTPHLYFLFAGFMILVFWGWWLLEHTTDLRIVGRGGHASADPLPTWVPTIATPAALLFSFVWWKRSVGIAENGILLDARIDAFGGSGDGMRDVTMSYAVDGKNYSEKMSVSETQLGNRQVGDSLQIVADKRKPSRIMLNS